MAGQADLEIFDRLSRADWLAIDTFMAEAYGISYIMRDFDLFSWQFGMGGREADLTVATARRDGQIIGMLGYIPVTVSWGDATEPLVGAWLVNWMVAEGERTGIGPVLMRRLQELYPLLFSQGANSTNRLIAERMGFHFYQKVHRFAAIFDAGACKPYLVEGVDVTELRAWTDPGLDGECELWPAERLRSEFAPNWSSYDCARFGTLRDLEYLNWRYFNHPHFTYHVLAAGSESHPALCVYRIEKSSGRATQNVGRIVEFLCARGDVASRLGATLLNIALREMKRRACVFADFYCSSAHLTGPIRAAGMVQEVNAQLASRLNPVATSTREQNLEVWVKSNLPPPPELCDYYVTKSDGDQDRPNHAISS